jgi:hypothetical protein
MSRFARLMKLKELLVDSGITEAKRLAARLGVKERTIYRDMKVLEEWAGDAKRTPDRFENLKRLRRETGSAFLLGSEGPVNICSQPAVLGSGGRGV